MNMKNMKEVFSEEAFVKALFEMESAAEMQEALNSKGITLSEEELMGVRAFLHKEPISLLSLRQKGT